VYAFGEIILVVFGILIALQINNRNDLRKDREKELHYLENIKVDLNITIADLTDYLATRNQSIAAAEAILSYFEGKPIEDYRAFNASALSIYNWQKFYQNNNTFQELINSGNLALISNDSIKNMLLNIESLYKKLKSEEEHYRFDTEELIYKPLYHTMDLSPLVKDATHYFSGGQQGEDTKIDAEYFKPYFSNTMIKNGFLMTTLEFGIMNEQMTAMKQMAEALTEVIDRDIAK
jgi:hypothetical protein